MKIKKIRWVSPDVLLLPPVLKNGRRGVRVVEGARLESVYSGNAIAGSNPALSAKLSMCPNGDAKRRIYFVLAAPPFTDHRR
jgi:hypothetical protein